VTLFVPIVHERAPSHGPKRSKPSFSQILHPGMLGEKAPGLTAQFYCCSTRPSTWPPIHPVPLLKEKKSSCPGSWKLNQSTSLRSNVSQSRRCNSIIYNEAVFRFVSLDPQPSLSLTPSPSLFHSPFYIPVSLFILYTLSQFSVGSYRVRSSQVSMLSSLFCCRRPQSLAICIYFYECVFVGVRV